jgi:RNA polymerase sigma factor for flagellar operon FliA
LPCSKSSAWSVCVRSRGGPASKWRPSSLTELHSSGITGSKPSRDPSRASHNLLTAEQELVMTEHLPLVRFIVRTYSRTAASTCAHRRPLQCRSTTVARPPSGGSIHPNRLNSAPLHDFVSMERYLIVCERSTGVLRGLRRKGRAVEHGIQALIGEFGRTPTDIEIAQKLNIPLADYQQLLGDLRALEIGSLHAERSEDSDEEELDLLPGRLRDDPFLRCLSGE